MNKPIDMSVLPDGFLLECSYNPNTPEFDNIYLWLMCPSTRKHLEDLMVRPALNYWHFNDGSMVLPDGLVVEVFESDGKQYKSKSSQLFHKLLYCFYEEGGGLTGVYKTLKCDAILGVKILGVTAEYGAQLGMEVIE